MSTFVVDLEHGLVLAIIAAGDAGFGGTAFIRCKPVPIGVRATEDGAVNQVLSLACNAGLRIGPHHVKLVGVDADITVLPRTWRPAAAVGERRR